MVLHKSNDPVLDIWGSNECVLSQRRNMFCLWQIPDIFVLVNGARELWEIKPEKGANSHEVRRRTEILRQELRHYGITYRLQVAEQFCSQPLLDNCNVLLRFGRRPVSEREHWQVEQVLTQLGSFSWESVCSGHPKLRPISGDQGDFYLGEAGGRHGTADCGSGEEIKTTYVTDW
jgi:hypothetical protein